jgi:cobalt-zinc-cadmium efflux system protein
MSHSHDHHDHGPSVSSTADRRYLTIALLLLLGFMLVEVVVGLLASSLALISDAGHMLTDAGAIGLSLVAMHWAAQPAAGHFTFGFKRVEILSAFANGLTLILLAVWFVIEAITRLIHPPEVNGLIVMVVALIGMVVNALAVWVMRRANRESLNVEGSFQHILTDLYAFIATAIAGGLIWLTGWNRLDTLAALLVAGLMIKAGWFLVLGAGRVFLEAAPKHLDPKAISESMCCVKGISGVSDLHVWEVTSGFPALAAQVFVEAGQDSLSRRHELETLLKENFAIEHSTLQMDFAEPGEVEAGCTAITKLDV